MVHPSKDPGKDRFGPRRSPHPALRGESVVPECAWKCRCCENLIVRFRFWRKPAESMRTLSGTSRNDRRVHAGRRVVTEGSRERLLHMMSPRSARQRVSVRTGQQVESDDDHDSFTGRMDTEQQCFPKDTGEQWRLFEPGSEAAHFVLEDGILSRIDPLSHPPAI